MAYSPERTNPPSTPEEDAAESMYIELREHFKGSELNEVYNTISTIVDRVPELSKHPLILTDFKTKLGKALNRE
jgi:hypothetical protein